MSDLKDIFCIFKNKNDSTNGYFSSFTRVMKRYRSTSRWAWQNRSRIVVRLFYGPYRCTRRNFFLSHALHIHVHVLFFFYTRLYKIRLCTKSFFCPMHAFTNLCILNCSGVLLFVLISYCKFARRY